MMILKKLDNNAITTMAEEVNKDDSDGALFQVYWQAWIIPMLETLVLEN